MRIGTLGGGDFLQVGLENSVYKNSEFKSQAKKMILIVNIFFVGAKWFFLHFLARDCENFKFLGDLIFFLGDVGGGGWGELSKKCSLLFDNNSVKV